MSFAYWKVMNYRPAAVRTGRLARPPGAMMSKGQRDEGTKG